MRPHRLAACTALAAALAVTGCGKSATSTGGSGTAVSAADSALLSPTTPKPAGPAGTLNWALYRDVSTIDPIQAFDYPDNTAITAMCDSILRQAPDGSIGPGLATASQPNDRTIVFAINPAATFWNGKPVTAADVAYSLDRNTDKQAAGFYGEVFKRVAKVEATGPKQVTVTLSKPDQRLQGELSGMAGIVLEKAYVEAQGRKFGTPDGGTMCSGAMKLKVWKPGTALTVEANDGYWDATHKAQTKEINFKGVPDDASQTSALLTGAIDGSYKPPLSSIAQFQASDAVTVHRGPSLATAALVVSSLKGVLATKEARQALSMAIDRKAYIDTQFSGFAVLPRTLANPGTWGYGKQVFSDDWDARPEPKVEVAKATAMIKRAGLTGKTLTIGMSTEIATVNSAATAVRAAAESIGLKVRFKATSAQSYVDFFTDPKARVGVDAFSTINYPDFADPAAFYSTFALKGGSQNYDGFESPAITKTLETARTTADPDQRAKLVAKAGGLINDELPWIALAAPNTILVMNKKITGAPASFVYMGGPWVNTIGAASGR